MDAILISANRNLVEMDDALTHLEQYEQLFWDVPVPIKKANFQFPIWAFIHISGEGVQYRATVIDILPFSSTRAVDPSVKPLSWRGKAKAGETHRAKTTLVMTELAPFYVDVKSFQKHDGEAVTLAPRSYVRVLIPKQSGPKPQQRSERVLLHERNLEDFLVHQLGHIESGLRLEARQLSTPAGRLDLLCRDSDGRYVVVELKRNRGSDQVVGQLLRYMGWVKQEHPREQVRGIVVCETVDEALEYAVSAVPDILVKKFRLSFD